MTSVCFVRGLGFGPVYNIICVWLCRFRDRAVCVCVCVCFSLSRYKQAGGWCLCVCVCVCVCVHVCFKLVEGKQLW